WLRGPWGSTRRIGEDFFEQLAAERGLTVLPPDARAGLLPGLEALRGPSFDPARVDPIIDGFYARTASFDLTIDSRWSGPFRAVGWFIGRLFARRLAQLNMPISGRELRAGIDSRIVQLADAQGRIAHTAWVRIARQTHRPVFVGQYGTACIPGHAGPCVKVVFPLPNGNATILLRPRADPEGGLSLLSDGRRFGDPGFYFTVDAGEGAIWARYVRTMKEELRLWSRGPSIEARHRFGVFGLPFLELRYAIAPRPASGPRAPTAARRRAPPAG
ncbi:MAG: hypothetical protein KDK70_30150, partial [Myxococcales bacterium]|nr:hypothetical protein [Myxococcales bacterium]